MAPRLQLPLLSLCEIRMLIINTSIIAIIITITTTDMSTKSTQLLLLLLFIPTPLPSIFFLPNKASSSIPRRS